MKRTTLILFLLAVLFSAGSMAQSNHTLVSIGNKQYQVEEFDFIYSKNNNFSEEPKSKKEYIALFVNYKLKVHEAIAQGLDTLPSFKKEYNYYKEELAKPYLSDSKVTEKLIQEAYDRLKTEINASHILIKLPPSPTPEDTLAAYRKINAIVDKFNNGEDFNKLALQYSDDPSARKNQGKLGYFTGFMMVYPFESAAFNTPKGSISPITRTSFGYHLVQVHDKRPNRGEVLTAHIMQMFPRNASQELIAQKKAKIDSVYQLLLQGQDFAALAQQYSDDRNSAANNGQLPWFGTGRMVAEFSEPAFALDSVNNISEIVRTPYGFHIIKFLDKRGIKPLEEMREEIEDRIASDERAYQSKQVVVARLKEEYGFSKNKSLYDVIKQMVADNNVTNDEFFEHFKENENNIATMKGWELKTGDLMAELKKNRQFMQNRSTVDFDVLMQDFIGEAILKFEKTKLRDKYPEYKYLLNEYHDGLLIFDISQKEIWNKAIEDSIGIQNYFEAHKSAYFHPEKLDGILFLTNDKKELKAAKKLLQVNPEITADSLQQLYPDAKVIKNVFEKGEYQALDKQIWKIKKSEGKEITDFKYAWASGKRIPKKQKELDETRGQVIADYQNQIEKEWLAGLKAKYSPVVNAKALKYSK
ncbi:peptidyl-prolyl cis-trans isomerase SurA [Saccharicrinis carchari]|uniref:Peptidyl-prolyl cis-trans isomerase SurA n=1 Tax=Saccharicrinis carchari TaxID=1168039 RepID=A0A521D1I2_SACCC|nr:peptidylprolyl isomerase [Saccharicrinis carchari]SMO65565.1 peptidyl-prolyl cis-trans isomerase SurA [Saccharicrinis carchari]